MRLAVLKEHASGERRVSLVPETVKRLISKGFEVVVEASAGDKAFISDAAYLAAGASIEVSTDTLCAHADLIVRIQTPSLKDIKKLKPGATLICALDPLRNPALVHSLAV